MTTQVYYQKWRPSCFSQLVGQEHVSTTLRQSAKQGRVSHSYLFCGPRGSGKTTTARILAKVVNCLDLQDGDACNACIICQSINEGRFMDIIELDAASNRGIDEIRDIREKVNFSPVQGRRKVYIIDEAHMLTDAASNAFLKTLEEPPGHVIFILCTTEAHKILPTIISRCQRFDFRRISSDLINTRLEEITRTEGVAVDPDALRLVSRYAGGSLRDAENLLEQLAVSYADGISVRQVEELLGLGHGERELELVSYLLTGNTADALGAINQAAWDGVDSRQLHRQTLELLRAAMLVQWRQGDSAGSLDLAEQTLSRIRELTAQVQGGRIVRALKLWGDVNMRHDAPSTLPLEVAAVEICGYEDPALNGAGEQARSQREIDAPPTRLGAVADRPPAQQRPASRAPQSQAPPPSQAAAPTSRPQPPWTDSTPAPVASRPPAADDNSLAGRWSATVKALGRHKGRKYNLGALLRDCRADAIAVEGDTLVLAFTHRAHMERMQEEMEYPEGKRQVQDVVNQHLGSVYDLKLTLLDEKRDGGAGPAQNSPLVRIALGMGARIIEEVSE